MKFQTVAYSNQNSTVLFESNDYESPIDAMSQLNRPLLMKEVVPNTPHHSVIRVLENEQIIDEVTFLSTEIDGQVR